MKKSLDPKTVTRRSFLRAITGVSAVASGIFLGLISPSKTWGSQQEGSDSSERAGRSSSDSDASDQSEGSDASDRSASDSDSDASDSSGR